MKRIILFAFAGLLALGLGSCKKEDNNGNNNGGSSQSCKLKSIKEEILVAGSPLSYSGFVLYYDGDKIVKANFIDSVTGNEDTTSYALLSYNSGNLTDVKLYQKGALTINFNNAYNSSNKITQRDYSINSPFGLVDINQKYFYDANGRVSYTVRSTTIDNFPGVGKVVSKDSGIFLNYNSKGRPAGLITYRSSETSMGVQPYSFQEEYSYEYDANGNRIKESSKSDIAEPFKVNFTATFDLTKTPGDAEIAYKLLTRLVPEDWTDPNLTSKDIDVNLKTSHTDVTDTGNETTTTTYTFNSRNSPITAKETGPEQTKNTAYTYECK